MGRLHVQSLLKEVDRDTRFGAVCEIDVAQAVESLEVTRVQPDRFLESLERVVGHVQSLERLRHPESSLHRLGVELHHFPIKVDRFIELSGGHVHVGQLKVRFQVVGIELDRLFELAGRFLRALGLKVGATQVQVVLSVVRLQLHGSLVSLDRLLGLAEFVSHQTQVVSRERVLWVETSRLAVVGGRGFKIFLTVIGLR